MGTAKNMDFPSYVLCCVLTFITMTGRLGADKRTAREESWQLCGASGGSESGGGAAR